MKRADIPSKFSIPFAESAGGAFRRTVPIPSQIGIQDGAASFTTGFPPDNFSPIAAGGVPPFGADVNGVLFQMSAWDRWYFSGGPVTYDSAYSAAIGGYPKGAVVASVEVFGRLYLSLFDDNVTNPDAGGANWKAFAFNTTANGQCYFLFVSATQAKLVPRGGGTIVIAGAPCQIPVAGIAVNLTSCFINGIAAQAAAANTLYNAFLFDNAGVLTVDLWTGAAAGHIADPTLPDYINVGVEIRNNAGTPDSTRSLIGKIQTNSSAQLVAQGTSVISWFNRRRVKVSGAPVPGPTNITTTAELSTAARMPFLCWGDEATTISILSIAANDTPGNGWTLLAGLDGGLLNSAIEFSGVSEAAFRTSSGFLTYFDTIPEGAHFATIIGTLNPGTTAIFSEYIVYGEVSG